MKRVKTIWLCKALISLNGLAKLLNKMTQQKCITGCKSVIFEWILRRLLRVQQFAAIFGRGRLERGIRREDFLRREIPRYKLPLPELAANFDTRSCLLRCHLDFAFVENSLFYTNPRLWKFSRKELS